MVQALEPGDPGAVGRDRLVGRLGRGWTRRAGPGPALPRQGPGVAAVGAALWPGLTDSFQPA
jgi:hypothetical protein